MTNIGVQKFLLRTDEVAVVLNCCKDTVRALLDCGELESVAVNPTDTAQRRHLRVTRTSVEKFIERRKQ